MESVYIGEVRRRVFFQRMVQVAVKVFGIRAFMERMHNSVLYIEKFLYLGIGDPYRVAEMFAYPFAGFLPFGRENGSYGVGIKRTWSFGYDEQRFIFYS